MLINKFYQLYVTSNIVLSNLTKFSYNTLFIINKNNKQFCTTFLKNKKINNFVFKKIIEKIKIDYQPLIYPFQTTKKQDMANSIEIEYPEVRGMKKLNTEAFNKKIRIPCLIVKEKDLEKMRYKVKRYIFKFKKINHFVNYDKTIIEEEHDDLDIPETERKVVVLNPERVQTFETFGEHNIKLLNDVDITEKNFAYVWLLITYNNFGAEEILKYILPENEMISSFTVAGHIVQINLKENLYEYKEIIGQIIMDKTPTCKTVVNKIDTIDNTYRNINLELIAGEKNYVTIAKENGCQYKMDFSKVYWNSRLSTEHERILRIIKRGDIVYDVFAGIGPFSIPAAKRGITVLANDLNPESVKFLKENIHLNNIKERMRNYKIISVFNKDGKDFLQYDVPQHLTKLLKNNKILKEIENHKIHFIMNLPAIAITFLQYLKIITQKEFEILKEHKITPVCYLYCFLPKLNTLTKEKVDINEEFMKLLQTNQIPIDENDKNDVIKSIDFVRNVSPNKDMYRAVLYLNEKLLVTNKRICDDNDDDNNISKQIKYEIDY